MASPPAHRVRPPPRVSTAASAPPPPRTLQVGGTPSPSPFRPFPPLRRAPALRTDMRARIDRPSHRPTPSPLSTLAPGSQTPDMHSVARSPESARNQFLRRMFTKVAEEKEISTWETTLDAMSLVDLPEIFAKNMNVFEEFMAKPTKENFRCWRDSVHEYMDDGGVFDDWNMSKLFFAILTQRYDDLDIADDKRRTLGRGQ